LYHLSLLCLSFLDFLTDSFLSPSIPHSYLYLDPYALLRSTLLQLYQLVLLVVSHIFPELLGELFVPALVGINEVLFIREELLSLQMIENAAEGFPLGLSYSWLVDYQGDTQEVGMHQ